MKHRKLFISIALGVVIVAQAACNLPTGEQPDAAATLNALYTQSAQTLEAMATQAALTAVGTQPSASPTVTPTNTLLPGFSTPTSIPPFYTNTPVTRCDWAYFVDDVTYEDGTTVGRNLAFTKTWRLKNIGTCAWTTSYALVFVSGDAMGAPTATGLPFTVSPGETADISVNLVSPNLDGHYRGEFKLRNASGLLFGVGNQASTAFWVDIKVSGTSFIAYDFATNYCDAQWSNNQKALPCPGVEGDNDGYVIKLDSPKLENGDPAGNHGLITYPRDANNGIIKGVYPPIHVQEGDRFRSIINCRYNSSGCDVVFRLDYQVGNGAVNNLGQWNEAYEGLSYTIDIDLSDLEGYNVKFILSVFANDSSVKDFAIWIGPQILRQGTPPPTDVPTFTFTPTATSTATPTPTSTATPTTGP